MLAIAAQLPPLRLRKRSEFVKVAASGCKIVTTTIVLQAARTEHSPPDAVRVGFTVTKRCGNAVVRNRIRRRMRAVAQELIPALGETGTDYVLIGRYLAETEDFTILRRDLRYALRKMPEKLRPSSPEKPVLGL